MKLATHNNSLQTNIKAETQNFGIGDASVVIEILRNRLYEHKIRTSVQEYMCNGRDAMREIGNTNPIEVSIPTRFSPIFKVRDFGPGISPDRMQNVFVMYGSSTKRGDNGQTGGFGIGAKSAWSYTDSFNIITFVNGTKRTYVAHTGVNNNGRLDLISTETTKEANGTEIQIAVNPQDVDAFKEAVFRASYFWPTRPIYKGSLDTPNKPEGIEIAPGLHFAKSYPSNLELGYGRDVTLVIDGVPYVLSDALVDRVPSLDKLQSLIRGKLFLFIKNGEVEVSASREKVADSKQTIEFLQNKSDFWFAKAYSTIREAFKKVGSVSEFIETYRELSKTYNVSNNSTYGSYSVYNEMFVSELFKKVNLTVVTRRQRRNGDAIVRDEGMSRLSFAQTANVFLPVPGESAVMSNRRLREYLQTHHELVLLTPKAGDQMSVDTVATDLQARSLSTLPLPVVEKAVRVKIQREEKQFCLHTFRSERYHYTTLASNTQQWLYFEVTDEGFEYDSKDIRELEYYLREIGETYRICGLADRALKMVKGNANFSSLKDWLAAFKPNDSQVKSGKHFASASKETVESLTAIAKHGLKDTFLNEMIDEYASFQAKPVKLTMLPKLLAPLVHATDEYKTFVKNDKALTVHLKKYPLFSDGYYSRRETEEYAFYLNAKYTQLKKEGKVS